MTDERSAAGNAPADADIRQREADILGAPPRVAPLRPDERTPLQQQLIEKITPPAAARNQQGAGDTEWVEILARHPDLLVAHLAFAQKFMADGTIAPRDRELCVLRLAWLSRAPFEWGAHVQIAKGCGVSDAEIEGIIAGSAAPGWSKHDRALLRAVEELEADSMVTDATWADLAETLEDQQLIELLMLVGQYKTVAYYQNALRFRLPAGNAGLAAR